MKTFSKRLTAIRIAIHNKKSEISREVRTRGSRQPGKRRFCPLEMAK